MRRAQPRGRPHHGPDAQRDDDEQGQPVHGALLLGHGRPADRRPQREPAPSGEQGDGQQLPPEPGRPGRAASASPPAPGTGPGYHAARMISGVAMWAVSQGMRSPGEGVDEQRERGPVQGKDHKVGVHAPAAATGSSRHRLGHGLAGRRSARASAPSRQRPRAAAGSPQAAGAAGSSTRAGRRAAPPAATASRWPGRCEPVNRPAMLVNSDVKSGTNRARKIRTQFAHTLPGTLSRALLSGRSVLRDEVLPDQAPRDRQDEHRRADQQHQIVVGKADGVGHRAQVHPAMAAVLHEAEEGDDHKDRRGQGEDVVAQRARVVQDGRRNGQHDRRGQHAQPAQVALEEQRRGHQDGAEEGRHDPRRIVAGAEQEVGQRLRVVQERPVVGRVVAVDALACSGCTRSGRRGCSHRGAAPGCPGPRSAAAPPRRRSAGRAPVHQSQRISETRERSSHDGFLSWSGCIIETFPSDCANVRLDGRPSRRPAS